MKKSYTKGIQRYIIINSAIWGAMCSIHPCKTVMAYTKNYGKGWNLTLRASFEAGKNIKLERINLEKYIFQKKIFLA